MGASWGLSCREAPPSSTMLQQQRDLARNTRGKATTLPNSRHTVWGALSSLGTISSLTVLGHPPLSKPPQQEGSIPIWIIT